MANGFVRWTLRTIDVDAARSFYDALLEDGAPDVSELPAPLRARGAKPHWLGHLAVPAAPGVTPGVTTGVTTEAATRVTTEAATRATLDAALAAFVARGATRLGNGELLRDPSGALLALTSPCEPTRRDVAWQQLLTPNPARAKRDYGDLFGMTMGARVEVPGHGPFDQFSWGVDANDPRGPSGPRGSIGDLTGKPHIHPQWLFFFRVPDLEPALSHLRTHGGSALPATLLPDGRRVAICEDPQGAQLALMTP